MGTLQWAGTVAAALIAIGTVAGWIVRRLVHASRWIAAVIELPETVDGLRQSVDTLTTSVDTLSRSVNGLTHPVSSEESSRVSVLPL